MQHKTDFSCVYYAGCRGQNSEWRGEQGQPNKNAMLLWFQYILLVMMERHQSWPWMGCNCFNFLPYQDLELQSSVLYSTCTVPSARDSLLRDTFCGSVGPCKSFVRLICSKSECGNTMCTHVTVVRVMEIWPWGIHKALPKKTWVAE